MSVRSCHKPTNSDPSNRRAVSGVVSGSAAGSARTINSTCWPHLKGRLDGRESLPILCLLCLQIDKGIIHIMLHRRRESQRGGVVRQDPYMEARNWLTDGSIQIRPFQSGDVDQVYAAVRESLAEVGRWLPD